MRNKPTDGKVRLQLRPAILALVLLLLPMFAPATVQADECVKFVFGTRLQSGIRPGLAWALLVNGQTNAVSQVDRLATQSVWMVSGQSYTVTLRCMTESDYHYFDYELHIGDIQIMDFGSPVFVAKEVYTTPAYRVTDAAHVAGYHLGKGLYGVNTFDPTDKEVKVYIWSQNQKKQWLDRYGDGRARSKDPINLMTGNLSLDEADIAIPCPGPPLEFRRRYNTGDNVEGSLGMGWAHSYDWRLQKMTFVTGNSNSPTTNIWIILRTPDGLQYNFQALSNGTYDACYDNNWRLGAATNGAGVTNGYGLTLPAGTVYSFNSNGMLTSVADMWSNSLTLSYTTIENAIVLLSSVQHSNGQYLNFSYSGTRLSDVWTPISGFYMHFEKDGSNQLVRATRVTANGNQVTTYSYPSDPSLSVSSLITQRTNAAGDAFVYDYPTNYTPTGTNLVVGNGYYRHGVDYPSSNRSVLTYYRTSGSNQIYEYLYDFDAYDLREVRGPHSETGIVSRGVLYAADSYGNTTNTTVYDNSVGESNITVTLFDAWHNVTSTAFGYCAIPSNWSSYVWDTNLNILVSATDPEGGNVAFEYTNALIARARLYYDATNSFDTVFSYTTNGLLAGVTNANGHWVQYFYNNYGFAT